MDNIWFYTLSTSAQVLAALAGLFAVFAVWKLQDSEKILSEVRSGVVDIIDFISSSTEQCETLSANMLYSRSDQNILEEFSKLLSAKEKGLISAGSYSKGESSIRYSLDKPTEAVFKNYINKKQIILDSLKIILIMNFSAICICILELTFSFLIPCKILVLAIISLLVIYCLYLIGNSIYGITSR